ncbi:MAG: T9SS type A sorting domain-containing protein [Candidatus Syntrophosphaera sp.]|nr:T9SS type A sorting domain-containing protein [Candidatus Syntrophosphaera sp.]
MKKILLVVLTLSLLLTFAFAKEMQVGTNKKPIDTPALGADRTPVEPLNYNAGQTREVPEYTFTKLPTAIITNYYDYMIGSYNGLPLRVIPDVAGGGYFMTYHGRRQATATRRAFYTYIDPAGNIVNNNEITSVQNHEGYTTVAVDPVSGKPIYAWHANADTDGELEVQVTSDAFIAGIAGLFNDVQVAIDNPYTLTAPDGTVTNLNEFIWPTAQIGPSPVAGKRRVYLAARNSESQTYGPSENLLIAYADFDGDEIEMGTPLVWNHISIPEMNQWNVDAEWRRPFHSLTTDNAGNLYYAGYHFATTPDASENIREHDLDVFVCPNYGQGTWTRLHDFSWIPTWNPPGQPGGTGYFIGDGDIAYPDTSLTWAIANSSHINAGVDSYGRIHVLGSWAMSTKEGGYWPDYQNIKEFVFDPATQEFYVKEVYPQKDPSDTVNQTFTPWDMEAPWGEAEYVLADDNEYYLGIAFTGHPGKMWPFPHWDTTAHGDAMMFHYNNTKVSDANDHGMMVAVWQNSQRARWFNYNSDTDYSAFANTPELMISVSPDNGATWSQPINLNNVETPEFSGIKPMWVYPADKVLFTGMQGQNKVGKIGFMFYNDFTWGSNAITPSYHPTPDGGEVMFMEMQIVFPVGDVSNSDNSTPAVTKMLHQNYPNPFNPETTISFDMPASGHANLSVYNVKGQLVKTLVNENLGFGRQSFVWNGTDNNGQAVTSGLYFYRLTAGGSVETNRMMLMK